MCVGPWVVENWPNICEDIRRLLSTAETQKEAEGFWLSPELLLVRPMKKRGEDQTDREIFQLGGALFLELWATDEPGGAEGNRDLAFRNTEMLPSLLIRKPPTLISPGLSPVVLQP